MTVVLETTGPLTYVGRYDQEDAQGIHLLDVGIHDDRSGISRREYIERSSRFGIRSEHRHLVVPADQVARIAQLGTWEQALPRQ
jgi:hypothetical protein